MSGKEPDWHEVAKKAAAEAPGAEHHLPSAVSSAYQAALKKGSTKEEARAAALETAKKLAEHWPKSAEDNRL